MYSVEEKTLLTTKEFDELAQKRWILDLPETVPIALRQLHGEVGLIAQQDAPFKELLEIEFQIFDGSDERRELERALGNLLGTTLDTVRLRVLRGIDRTGRIAVGIEEGHEPETRLVEPAVGPKLLPIDEETPCLVEEEQVIVSALAWRAWALRAGGGRSSWADLGCGASVELVRGPLRVPPRKGLQRHGSPLPSFSKRMPHASRQRASWSLLQPEETRPRYMMLSKGLCNANLLATPIASNMLLSVRQASW